MCVSVVSNEVYTCNYDHKIVTFTFTSQYMCNFNHNLYVPRFGHRVFPLASDTLDDPYLVGSLKEAQHSCVYNGGYWK